LKYSVAGNIVDVVGGKIFPGEVLVKDGRIYSVSATNKNYSEYILPGLVDAHVHVESSMLTPGAFGELALMHGTTQCVSDPHEIANVLGEDGVAFMIQDAKNTPLKITYGAPSCVPATDFETSGARILPEQVGEMLDWEAVGYLSEVMNFPGVIAGEPGVISKINEARKRGMVIDGHAPGLTGADLDLYIKTGITTDHECGNINEALEKISKGMKILIRQGSAAKNLYALSSLVDRHPEDIMFCTDDLHPDDLYKGHMNEIFKSAVKYGCDVFNALRGMTLNPVRHYSLDQGLLQQGDVADFIVVNNLDEMRVKSTYVDGIHVFEQGEKSKFYKRAVKRKPNVFCVGKIDVEDIIVKSAGSKIKVIVARDGKLVTGAKTVEAKIEKDQVITDVSQDVLKIVVVNRYIAKPSAVGFVRGFGLKLGAIASSIAHDSHNIVCVGVNDEDIMKAINYIIVKRGGIVAASDKGCLGIPLPVAGIMSDGEGEKIARYYGDLNNMARKMGSAMKAPFMTLSFMSLLVIPELKLGDMGLFDVNEFRLTDLFL